MKNGSRPNRLANLNLHAPIFLSKADLRRHFVTAWYAYAVHIYTDVHMCVRPYGWIAVSKCRYVLVISCAYHGRCVIVRDGRDLVLGEANVCLERALGRDLRLDGERAQDLRRQRSGVRNSLRPRRDEQLQKAKHQGYTKCQSAGESNLGSALDLTQNQQMQTQTRNCTWCLQAAARTRRACHRDAAGAPGT